MDCLRFGVSTYKLWRLFFPSLVSTVVFVLITSSSSSSFPPSAAWRATLLSRDLFCLCLLPALGFLEGLLDSFLLGFFEATWAMHLSAFWPFPTRTSLSLVRPISVHLCAVSIGLTLCTFYCSLAFSCKMSGFTTFVAYIRRAVRPCGCEVSFLLVPLILHKA